MKIVRMQATHLDKVTLLSDQLGYPVSINEITKRFYDISKSSTHSLFVAIDKDEKVCGWIQVNIEPDSLVAGDRAEISALIVDVKQRGKNIGGHLVKEAESWAKSRNINFMRIRSNVTREGTHRFYQREGYTLTKSWHLFTKELKGT